MCSTAHHAEYTHTLQNKGPKRVLQLDVIREPQIFFFKCPNHFISTFLGETEYSMRKKYSWIMKSRRCIADISSTVPKHLHLAIS